MYQSKSYTEERLNPQDFTERVTRGDDAPQAKLRNKTLGLPSRRNAGYGCFVEISVSATTDGTPARFLSKVAGV